MLPGNIFIFLLTIPLLCVSLPSSGIQASVDSHVSTSKKIFVPMVAFHCGYRNQYTKGNGEWITDKSKSASCLTGKLDILKYCRKVYSELNITNIVEYSHEERIEKWCHEDDSSCKLTQTVRPYRCIDGEFVAQALQVPNGCTFSHVSSRSMCNDYSQLNNKAFAECASKLSNGKPMVLRSFAVLQPCAIDLFRGVEFVCCPPVVLSKSVKNDAQKESNGSDDESYEDEDDEEDKSTESDDDKSDSEKQDPYFQEITNSTNEHEKFREAENRLEKRHKARVAKVINEWSELFDKYKKMKSTDVVKAETYKTEMIGKFRKTVASLEEEHKDLKRQIEDVHDDRVRTAFNEKKRKATHEYREALTRQVESDNTEDVIRTLKACIRAEEKDRYHMLNRYRHLLRADTKEADRFKNELLRSLKFIDLRINGTISMLSDFPQLEKTVGPIVTHFWKEYRREHTPEFDDDALVNNMGEAENQKLINSYKSTYQKLHEAEKLSQRNRASTTTTTTTSTTTTTAAPVVDDFKQELMGQLEDTKKYTIDEKLANDIDLTNDELKKLMSTMPKTKVTITKKVAPSQVEESTESDESESEQIKSNDTTKSEEDDDDEDSDESEDESDEKRVHIEIEPIISGPITDFGAENSASYFKISKLDHSNGYYKHSNSSQSLFTSNIVFFGFIGTLVAVVLVAATLFYSRNKHAGFMEVDVTSPEEKHVNGMQINGYENPTYSFFDANAPDVTTKQ
uniref:A4_EXTRA domain-containing protein n=1 Tax=Rhabditophanes sp. KR3021 TaxID=114890 RepID=A0AC35U3T7_9BILA